MKNINSILNLVHQRRNHIIFSILVTQFLKQEDVELIKKIKDKKYILDIDDHDIRIRKSKELKVENKEIHNLANLPSSEEKIIFRL